MGKVSYTKHIYTYIYFIAIVSIVINTMIIIGKE